MKKPDIKRLKYPLWFQIVFFILTVIAPLVFLMVEGYQAKCEDGTPAIGFKLTFGVMSSLVIVWSFINHFIIKRLKDKIEERQVKLEHDYEIDVGNPTKIKWLWFTNEMKLAIFNTISITLYGTLFAIVITAIAKQLMAIRGAIILIAIFYVVAYALKFIVITVKRGKDDD